MKIIPSFICLWICSGCNESFNNGLSIEIHNGTGSDLQDVHFTYRGGSNQIGILKPNQTRTALVSPAGTPPLVLSFNSQEGIQVSTNLDVYFEKNYKGKISIEVMQNGGIQLRSDIAL